MELICCLTFVPFFVHLSLCAFDPLLLFPLCLCHFPPFFLKNLLLQRTHGIGVNGSVVVVHPQHNRQRHGDFGGGDYNHK